MVDCKYERGDIFVRVFLCVCCVCVGKCVGILGFGGLGFGVCDVGNWWGVGFVSVFWGWFWCVVGVVVVCCWWWWYVRGGSFSFV